MYIWLRQSGNSSRWNGQLNDEHFSFVAELYKKILAAHNITGKGLKNEKSMKTLSYLNYSGIPYQAWSKCDDVIWVILQKNDALWECY